MSHSRADSRGFTFVELLSALALLALLLLITTPPLVEAVRNSQVNGAARQLAAEVRQARSQAVGSGWQCRVFGVSAGASHSRSNQYRLMSRASNAVSWPAAEDPASSSATLVVGEWIDVDREYGGVELNPSDSGEFAITFDPRGSPVELTLNFSPLRVSAEHGVKSVSVSTLGRVRID